MSVLLERLACLAARRLTIICRIIVVVKVFESFRSAY